MNSKRQVKGRLGHGLIKFAFAVWRKRDSEPLYCNPAKTEVGVAGFKFASAVEVFKTNSKDGDLLIVCLKESQARIKCIEQTNPR